MTIFCDLDGTLIDSSVRHIVLLKDLLSAYFSVVPFSVEDYLDRKTDGINTKTYLFEKGIDRVTAQMIAAAWAEHIEDDNYLETDTLYSDALPFLRAQKSSNRRVVFVSARKNETALQDTLERLQILKFADQLIIVSPSHAAQNKELQIKPIARLGDCFIGDTEVDIECATAVGLQGFALNRGFRSKAYWDRCKTVSYSNLSQICEQIEKMRDTTI